MKKRSWQLLGWVVALAAIAVAGMANWPHVP